MAGSVYKKSYDFQSYNSYYFAEKQFSITFAAFAKRKGLVPRSAAVGGPVAQLNRAFDYGSKGFRFES